MSDRDNAGMTCPLSPMVSMAMPSYAALPARGPLSTTALVPGARNLHRSGRTIPLAGVVLSDPRRRGMLRTESEHEKSHIAKTRGWLAAYGEVSRLRWEGSLRWGRDVKRTFNDLHRHVELANSRCAKSH